MISCRGLTKRFGEFTAVDGISLEVAPGTICACLGANGAGKSTTVRMLTGLLNPTSGEATVGGLDVSRDSLELRRQIGVLPEDLGLFEDLSVEEHLRLTADIYGVSENDSAKRLEQLIAALRLEPARHTFAGRCSHGTRKKTALAMALLPNPKVLFLDEPFEAIDPVTSKTMRDLLVSAAARGVTVFLYIAHSARSRRDRDPVRNPASGPAGIECRPGGTRRLARTGLLRPRRTRRDCCPGLAGTRLRAVLAVLRATYNALRREQQSRLKVPANNLYYAAVASIFMLDPTLALFVATVVLIVLFFPLSADPLRLAPASRLGLWPLSRGERGLVRAISPWLNPVTWLVAAFALWRRVSVGMAALASGVFALGFLAPWRRAASRGGVLRLAPRFPGALGSLVRKDLRGLVMTLDFYCALVPAVAAIGYRAAGLLPKDAFLWGTLLVLLAISTPAQTLFGLDGRAGLTRYRLLPMAGWLILLAKDIAFLLAAVTLTAGLAPAAGLAGALAALALGRKTAIQENRAQLRWRLQAGASFGPALVQIAGIMGAASFEHARGALVLVPCLALWAVSLWWGGRQLDAGELG